MGRSQFIAVAVSLAALDGGSLLPLSFRPACWPSSGAVLGVGLPMPADLNRGFEGTACRPVLPIRGEREHRNLPFRMAAAQVVKLLLDLA